MNITAELHFIWIHAFPAYLPWHSSATKLSSILNYSFLTLIWSIFASKFNPFRYSIIITCLLICRSRRHILKYTYTERTSQAAGFPPEANFRVRKSDRGLSVTCRRHHGFQGVWRCNLAHFEPKMTEKMVFKNDVFNRLVLHQLHPGW